MQNMDHLDFMNAAEEIKQAAQYLKDKEGASKVFCASASCAWTAQLQLGPAGQTDALSDSQTCTL